MKKSLTIFLIGVTGDLAKKKILVAIYKLFEKKLLPPDFRLIGNARRLMTQEEFKTYVKEIVKPEEKKWKQFSQVLFYAQGDATESTTYEKFAKYKRENCMWYVATFPHLYLSIIKNLKKSKLTQSGGWTKILIEKPFGRDLESSLKLDNELKSIFEEKQIYRIDHFLGKETVQNILTFRFANGLFENLWNRNFIDHIQVTFSEKFGVEGREEFYDEIGAVRDVVQNHLLIMLAILMMEEPESLMADDIRSKRAELLKAIRMYGNKLQGNVFFGQYKDYLKNSTTETATALKLEVHNKRWMGVPIYVITGKNFPLNTLEIAIQFRDPKNKMFKDMEYGIDPNILTFKFQPDEAISLKLFVKKPGHGLALDNVPMEFKYKNKYGEELIEAYERLIMDATREDVTLFNDGDSNSASWKLIDKILRFKREIKPKIYDINTWGPSEFKKIIEKDGRKWTEAVIE